MLNTLMDISEAETGTMALRLEPVALGDLVASNVTRIQLQSLSIDAVRAMANNSVDAAALHRHGQVELAGNVSSHEDAMLLIAVAIILIYFVPGLVQENRSERLTEFIAASQTAYDIAQDKIRL